MADVVDPRTRSRMMSSIRGRDTLPEYMVRRYLHGTGLRFRLQDRKLPGRPDLCFPKQRIALFVHGCFWHRHTGCKYASMPASRVEFWTMKFEANLRRDSVAQGRLRDLGWTPLVIWECETRDEEKLDMLSWQIRAW